jgi:hypothetical protein
MSTSHDNDELAIGHKKPGRMVMRESEGYRVINSDGCAVIVPNQNPQTVVVEQIDKSMFNPKYPRGCQVIS